MENNDKPKNNFTVWLNYMMEELAISYHELIPVINRTERTIGRYQGGTLPSLEIQEKIYEFICQKSCFKTYHHIDNQNFLRIFRNYCSRLKKEKNISQKRLANVLGVSQKTISTYMSSACNVRFTTEEQYRILCILLSANIEEIYELNINIIYHKIYHEFNYLGDYDNYLFGLLQNRIVLSQVDSILKKYMITVDDTMPKINKDDYKLMQRQLEACFRYTRVTPCNYNLTSEHVDYWKNDRKWILKYSHEGLYKCISSFSDFENVINTIASTLKEREQNQEITVNPSPETTSEQIMLLHLRYLNQYCRSERKATQNLNYKQIDSFIQNKTLMEMLFEDIYEIIQYEISIDERKPFYQPKPLPTAEETAEALCQYSPEIQEMILKHHEAFSDSPLFEESVLSPAGYMTTRHIVYLFLKKMGSHSFHRYRNNLMKRLQQTAFSNYEDSMLRPDGEDEWNMEETHARLYAFYQSSLRYHEMYQFKLRYDMPEISTNYHGKEHKEEFLKCFSTACKHQDMLKIIRCKLKFDATDWLLWNFIMIGCSVSEKNTLNLLFNYALSTT